MAGGLTGYFASTAAATRAPTDPLATADWPYPWWRSRSWTAVSLGGSSANAAAITAAAAVATACAGGATASPPAPAPGTTTTPDAAGWSPEATA